MLDKQYTKYIEHDVMSFAFPLCKNMGKLGQFNDRLMQQSSCMIARMNT